MKDNKFNKKKHLIKKIFFEWLIIVFFGLILYFIIKDSINHNVNFKIILSILVVIILYKEKLRYDSTLEYSDSMDLITKKYFDKDKIELNKFLLYSKQAIDIQTQKLKTLKLFSPIPIIIFSLEYFTKFILINFNDLFSKIINLNLIFNTSEWMAIGLFITTIYYIHLYKTTLKRRQTSILIYYESKIKLNELLFEQNNRHFGCK